MHETLLFHSRGDMLAATLTIPAGPGPHPGVVTAPGFAGVKEMLIPDYAAALAAAGIACMAFDYAGFGASEGKPRQHVAPRRQAASFRHALDALGRDPRIDATRLGAWGTSLSGGHALVTAAQDARVRAAVALIPFMGVRTTPDWTLVRAGVADLARRALRRPGGHMAVTGRPGDVAVMTSDGAAEWAAGMAADAPAYRNEVTTSSLLNMARHSPARAARRLDVPTRVILAEDDTITPAHQVRRALAGNPHVDIVGFQDTHFELFDDHRQATIDLTVDWFARHLAAERR